MQIDATAPATTDEVPVTYTKDSPYAVTLTASDTGGLT
jgi:hypothetical protein